LNRGAKESVLSMN